MKRLNLIVTAIFLFGAWLSNAQTQPEIWKNDPPHSQLYFTVTHLGFNKISGTFDDTVIEVTATEADFSDARFEVTAQTNSINTLVEARNNHLKSADFFDIETYPTLTFTSTTRGTPPRAPTRGTPPGAQPHHTPRSRTAAARAARDAQATQVTASTKQLTS